MTTSGAVAHPVKAFAIGVVLVFASLWLLQAVILPLVLAVALYAVLLPVTNWLANRDVSRGVSAFLMLFALVAAAVAISVLVIPVVIQEIAGLHQRAPVIVSTLEQWLGNLELLLADRGVKVGLKESFFLLWQSQSHIDANTLVSGTNWLASAAMTLLLAPVFAFFLIKDYSRLRNRLLNFLPNRYFELAWVIYYRVATQMQQYIRGVFLQISIQALIATLGFWLFGFSGAVMLGVITGLLTLIPYIGLIIAVLLPLVISLSFDPINPLMLAGSVIVVLVAHLIDNLVIVPTVIAGSVNLHPLVLMCSVIVMGYFFGALGMVLAIPLMGTLRIVLAGLWTGLNPEARMR